MRRMPARRPSITAGILRDGSSLTTPGSVWMCSTARPESIPRALPAPRPPTHRTTRGCWRKFTSRSPARAHATIGPPGPHGVFNRAAHYICVIALAEAGQVLTVVEGRADGMIIDEPRGTAASGTTLISFILPWARLCGDLSGREICRLSPWRGISQAAGLPVHKWKVSTGKAARLSNTPSQIDLRPLILFLPVRSNHRLPQTDAAVAARYFGVSKHLKAACFKVLAGFPAGSCFETSHRLSKPGQARCAREPIPPCAPGRPQNPDEIDGRRFPGNLIPKILNQGQEQRLSIDDPSVTIFANRKRIAHALLSSSKAASSSMAAWAS